MFLGLHLAADILASPCDLVIELVPRWSTPSQPTVPALLDALLISGHSGARHLQAIHTTSQKMVHYVATSCTPLSVHDQRCTAPLYGYREHGSWAHIMGLSDRGSDSTPLARLVNDEHEASIALRQAQVLPPASMVYVLYVFAAVADTVSARVHLGIISIISNSS